MTALAGRSAAALAAYSALLHRLSVDFAALRSASSNLDVVQAHLRRVELHVGAEQAALERHADRALVQRARLRAP